MKKKITKNTQERQITRRQMVGSALAAAGVITGAPTLLRALNLHNKLNIAMIACGGRSSHGYSGREHYGPLRRQPECRGCCGPEIPES
jgi:hypothetical protein